MRVSLAVVLLILFLIMVVMDFRNDAYKTGDAWFRLLVSVAIIASVGGWAKLFS